MRRFIALFTFMTAAAGCSSDSGDIGAPGSRLPEAKLTVISGGGQTATIGSSLTEPVLVRLDTAGVPANSAELHFVFQAYTSPGPNHHWYANTDAVGLASANGIITNAIPGPATITVNYTVCTVPGFKGCSKEEIRATIVIPVQIIR